MKDENNLEDQAVNNLKSILVKQNIKETARRLGVSRQTIYNWLDGATGMTLDNFLKIKALLAEIDRV